MIRFRTSIFQLNFKKLYTHYVRIGIHRGTLLLQAPDCKQIIVRTLPYNLYPVLQTIVHVLPTEPGLQSPRKFAPACIFNERQLTIQNKKKDILVIRIN